MKKRIVNINRACAAAAWCAAAFLPIGAPSWLTKPGTALPQPTQQVAGHTILKVFWTAALNERGIPALSPQVIFQDRAGRLWFGGGRGLASYDAIPGRWTDQSDAFGRRRALNYVRELGCDGRGRVWAGYGFTSHRPAFFEVNGWHDASELHPQGVSSLGAHLIPGREGRVWFVAPEGLLAYDGGVWAGPFGPPDTMIHVYNQFKLTYGDSDSAAFAELGERLRRDLGRPEARVPPWTSEVACGNGDRDGNIWLGTRRAIWRFDERARTWSLYPTHGLAGPVSRVFEDRFGRIWFADYRAHLVLYDKSRDEWTSYDLNERFPGQDAIVNGVLIDQQGRTIVATRPGLILLDERTKETTPVAVHLGGTLVHLISAMVEDNQGYIWIGSQDAIFVLKPVDPGKPDNREQTARQDPWEDLSRWSSL